MPLRFATWKRDDSPEMRAFFRERLLTLSIPEPNTGCWLWTLGARHWGYGALVKNGRSHPAHRLSYEIFVGPIPDGMTIDHLCRVPACVNPDHLEAVTMEVNNLRRRRELFGRPQTHCIYGHPFSGDNVRIAKNGHRTCKKCDARRQRVHQAQKRSQATA
jgi:HNH endonuclease